VTDVRFRRLEKADQAALWDWLHIALWDPPPAPLRPREVLEDPRARIYAEGWGRPGDLGVVAVVDGEDAGACWLRVLPPGVGLGSIDAVTPQLGISLREPYRGKGIGKRLMQETLRQAWLAGHEKVSLTVHPRNPARKMYEACGFVDREIRSTYHLMVANRFDPAPAAALLADAWKSGRQIVELPEAARPTTLAQGYDVQDTLIARMGEPVGGWKLGIGSAAAMRQFSLSRPLAGRVLRSRFHANGDSITLPHAPVTVEFEIAFVLGRDVAPGEHVADPMSAIAEVRPTFELVQSRFVDRRAVGWPSFVGDSVGFAALVVGEPIDVSFIDDVAGSVVIAVDGREKARGLAGDDLTYPRKAFEYLLAHAADRGATLKRGEIATLGAIGKPFDISGEAKVEASFVGRRLGFALVD
jgi:2-keto-4-pentenoate hydratase